MNKVNMLLGIVPALAALLIIFLAYLIKYKKQFNIIAGYDEQTVKDKDGLANWVGGTLILTGSLAFMLSILIFFTPHYTKAIIGVYAITIMVGAIIAAVGGSRFKV